MLATFVSMHAGLPGFAIWLIAVTWFAISCAVWLRLTRYSWFFSTLLFFLFLIRCSLLLCGVLEGYPLIHPLIGLAQVRQSLWVVAWISDVGALSLIIGFSYFIAQAVRTKKIYPALLALACLLPFAVGIFLYEKKEMKMQSTVVLYPWWYGCKSPMFAGYRIVHDLQKVCITATTIVMPESTFCFDLQEYQDFIKLWSDSVQGKTILLGGHRRICQSSDFCSNSVFVLRNGGIEQIYDKQHGMPFVERVPAFFDCIGLGAVFLEKKSGSGVLYHDDVVEISGHRYQIFICSELFFESKPVKGYPVLLVWNETWLYFDWVKDLALLFIDYFSVKHDVAVVHVSTQGRTNVKN